MLYQTVINEAKFIAMAGQLVFIGLVSNCIYLFNAFVRICLELVLNYPGEKSNGITNLTLTAFPRWNQGVHLGDSILSVWILVNLFPPTNIVAESGLNIKGIITAIQTINEESIIPIIITELYFLRSW